MRNSYRLALTISCLTVSLLILLALYPHSSQSFSLRESGSGTGKEAKGFTLKDLEGYDVSLSSFHGKVVLLNFWATWCPYCRKERVELNNLHEEYYGKDLVIISVAGDKSLVKVQGFIKRNPVDFIVLFDSDGEVSNSYGVRALPTNFLIDREGRIIKKYSGYRKWTDPPSSEVLLDLLGR
jgi:peroxiredoxin